MSFWLGCIGSYLLGGVPFALLLVALCKGVDVRTIGSGNVGATNASRAFTHRGQRLAAFLAIYVLDFAKGFVAAYWGPQLFAGPQARAVAFGACAILGHCLPVYLSFRGGKGVATTTGVIAALEPIALLVGLAVFGSVLATTRQVFLGSLAMGIAIAATVVLRDLDTAFDARLPVTILAVVVAGFLFWTHRRNLKGMLARRVADPGHP